MSALAPDTRNLRTSEPRPIIPPLAGFYSQTRDLSWLVVRLTAGGMLLVHGIMKVMPMTENGFSATIAAFATGSMARRGIEPAMYAAYAVFFLETVGAVMIILGLFTRMFAAALAIEFAIITFVAHWPAGFARWPTRMGVSPILGPHPVRNRIARRRTVFARSQARMGVVAHLNPPSSAR